MTCGPDNGEVVVKTCAPFDFIAVVKVGIVLLNDEVVDTKRDDVEAGDSLLESDDDG